MKSFFQLAVKNIVGFGDTDIFPFPIENHIFFDCEGEVVNLLMRIHSEFYELLADHPPVNESLLAPVGYTGFRWATQIDPVWNAYVLGLVLSIGEAIELARIPVEKRAVFSYRFKTSSELSSIFDPEIGWREFQERSLELAAENAFVLICDIADFYPRIYHHKLNNALRQLNLQGDTPDRIMSFLQHFAGNNSYGLPVGGPAARLLAELVLNRTDRLLASNGIDFCRFADDYHIFAKSREDAYAKLVFLSEKLLRNEGLALQKTKTRIMSSTEFVSATQLQGEDGASGKDVVAAEFLRVSLRYDPYSETANEDYEALKEELKRFDIVGMLGRELKKSRVHEALAKQLIKAVRYLSPEARSDAVRSLLQNVQVLAPLFSKIMILVKEVFDEVDDETRNYVGTEIRRLIQEGSYIMQIDLNLAYAVRVLASVYSDKNEAILNRVFQTSRSQVVKRDVILIMARWRASHWVADLKNYFQSLQPWERRAFIVASYSLRDEGKHWRHHAKKGFSPIEELFRKWAGAKAREPSWAVPI